MLKFKSLASQLCGIFPYTCLQFALGSVAGFHIILIAELHKKDSEIPTTAEELSWYASLNIVKLFGSICTGFLMHHLGCRTTGLITALTYITSLLMYHYSTTVPIVFISRTLSSLLMIRSLCAPYISEISEPQFRGPLLAMAFLSNAVGSFFSLLLGSFMYWRTIVLAILIFPVLAAVTVLATPNSPTWLANNGRLDEAERALCRVRGWVKPDEVQIEFRTLIEAVQKSKLTSEENKLGWQARSRNFFQLLTQRSFYLPLGTMLIIFFLYALGGSSATESYATVIFREMSSPIEESLATAILGAMDIVGHVVVLLSIHRVGKRKLVLFSVIIAGLSQAVIATVGLLELHGQYLWIPPIAMIVSSVATHSGVEAIVLMLNSEIFPCSVRYVGSSMSMAILMIMSATINKIFLYLVETFTLSRVFLFFAFVNLVSLVSYYFLFPETEEKSLKEIEDQFDGVKKSIKSDK